MVRIKLIIFSLVVLAHGVVAQDTRPMTPMDVAQIKYVGDAVISDDGSYIAYTLRVQADPVKENKSASFELYVYDVKSRESTRFTSRGSVRNIQFRPGSESVTFLNRLDGDKVTSLYEISLSGGEASRLYAFETSILRYEWSDDGSHIAFVAPEPEDKTDQPVYSPEIYEEDLTHHKAYIADAADWNAKPIETDGHVLSLEWSPQGDKIAMMVAKSPLVDDYYMQRTIHIASVEFMKSVAQIDHKGKKGDYCFSPDGNTLAFIAGANINDPTAGRLFTAPATGGAPTPRYHTWEGAFEQVEWLIDEGIHYLGSKGSEAMYGIADPNADDNLQGEVTDGLSITHFDIAPAGAVIMVASTAMHPPELFYSAGGEVEQLTNSNPWLDEIAFGEQEVITYKARDGLEIEGILIRPVDAQSDTRYPLIVSVHGGPEAHVDNGWITGYSWPGQVAAGKGYAVFYPNYRGSTGRGLNYILTSQGDPAGAEFDDIVDGVDHLINIGLVDEDKVGVTGGSYGGYATGWMSTRYTDRFAAGVMFVGISNKVSKWGTTDIPNEEYLVHARKWVYEDYDFWLKRSPIYYAGQCETPLLIMHGKEDPRVHPGQSMELYRHVKTRTDTPVQLVFYPGEGHGNARSAARYDYNLRMLGWFDKYLKEDSDKS